MGSGEEWANDGPKRGGWGCPIQLAGAFASVALVLYGLFVIGAGLLG